MSTFGKKSLTWWDYNDHSTASAKRFNTTPKNLQLEILQKWYPVGSRFIKFFDYSSRYGQFGYESFTEFEIISYCEVLYGWAIKYDAVNAEHRLRMKLQPSNINPINPFLVIVNPDLVKSLKRNSKLARLV